MADEDIDIEEHDVLDNPIIRNIFPDITVIKKEISQYYEDVLNIKLEPELNTICTKPSTDEIIIPSHPYEPVKDAAQKNPPDEPRTNDVDNSDVDNTHNDADKPLQSNKNILGSKPSNILELPKDGEIVNNSEKKTETVVRIPKVVLQDLGAYIYQNNRYCKDCRILFPSRSDFDVHIQKGHSIKTRNKQLNIKVTLENSSLKENRNNNCNICGSHFSYRANLNRHYRNIHKKIVTFKSKFKHNKTVSLKKILPSVTSVNKLITRKKQESGNVITSGKSSSEQKIHKCDVCGTYFSSSSNLSRHYKNIHNNKFSFIPKLNNNRTASSANNSSTSVKIMTRSQRNRESHNLKPSTDNLCFHCKKPFPDYKSLIEHIYEVLEPKHYPKEKFCKSKQNKKEYVTTSDRSKEGLNTSSVQDKEEPLKSKSFKNTLMFEDQDSDSSESRSLVTEEYNDNNDVETEHLSTADEIETKANKDQNIDPCCSKTLATKQKSDNEDLQMSIPQYLTTKEKTENQHSPESNTLKRKQKHDIQYFNSSGHKTGSKKNNKKRKLQPSGLKSFKTKQRNTKSNINLSMRPKTLNNKKTNTKNEQLSTASDNAMELELKCNETDVNNMKGRFVYECIYCSYMVPTARAYYMHIVGKHKVEKISYVNKVIFNEQCKYCPSNCKNETGHNKHLHSYHYDLVYKNFPNDVTEERGKKTTRLKNPAFKMFESFVLESIIYKCNKCDTHFLSSSIAKDHEKHMELLINWKCSICRRIFKKHDKYLHLKQHKFSKTLNVCEFNASELSRLLYNCTKCAIHFTEDRYLDHYSKCGIETTDSVYCKNCDILIDESGYKSHETYHKMGKCTSDFTIIVADIIEVTKSKEIEVDRKRKRLYQQANCLTFCHTCKCFLTDMGLTRKTHIESRCSEIPKFICKLCGLFLTHRALATHKEHHRKQIDLKLQDFKFFDLKGIQINPPIPEYPCCTNCDVVFVRKNDVKNHICSEIEFLTCPICNMKLTENAYKLHMNFHNYSIQNKNKDTSQAVVTLDSRKQEINLDRHKNTDTCSNAITECETEEKRNNVDSAVDRSGMNLVYSCQSCKIAVDTYNKVVEHCQNHFSPIPKTYTALKICSKCSLKFESDTYENHLKLHLRYDTIIFLSFDPMYFTSDNNTWFQHIFASEHQSIQKEVAGESIYQHECRIKMEVVQKGPSHLTVYKCDKCGNFIDPECIFVHVKNACPKNVRRHPCPVCGLPFMSTIFRSNHEKIHRRYDSVRIKSYNIVLFNSEAHNTYNNSIIKAVKQFVLYQCRTCEGVVDKLQRKFHQCNFDDLRKCSVCGLLIYQDYFDRHVSKHSDLARFVPANIKVILFGSKDELNQKIRTLSPSFGGKIVDYTVYKCAECDVCVNNEISISKHVCAFDDAKWKCPKCGFYICTRYALNQHIEMHDFNTEFTTENIKVITFELTKSNDNNLDHTKETKDSFDVENDNAKVVVEPTDRINTTPNSEIGTGDKSYDVEEQLESVILYKCICSLHFTDKLNAKKHIKCCNPKIKVIRQNCSKCSLVFNPKELFSHLIAHHGDKNKTYKYEIVEISAEDEDTVMLDV